MKRRSDPPLLALKTEKGNHEPGNVGGFQELRKTSFGQPAKK